MKLLTIIKEWWSGPTDPPNCVTCGLSNNRYGLGNECEFCYYINVFIGLSATKLFRDLPLEQQRIISRRIRATVERRRAASAVRDVRCAERKYGVSFSMKKKKKR